MRHPSPPRPSWLEKRRRSVFGWLLLSVFIIQNLGVWIAWQAGSPLQTALGVLGGGCTLYLLLSNTRSAISMTTAYRVGAGFLGLRLAVEIVNNALTGQTMTSVQYLESTILIAFLVTILPIRVSAALSAAYLGGILALTLQGGLHQIVEFMVLFMNAAVLHFTAEYGRQTYQAKLRIEELERQLVWDPLTGIANRPLIEERTRTFMLSPSSDAHLAVTLTLQGNTPLNPEERAALQHVVKALRPLLRESDSIGRWNENTLLLLFPHVQTEQQRSLLGTLNAALQDLQAHGLVTPDVQLGSATLNEALTPEDIVNKAKNQRQMAGP